MGDGRKVFVTFVSVDGGVQITEEFDAEEENPEELQRQGWQAILDRFVHYVETQSAF